MVIRVDENRLLIEKVHNSNKVVSFMRTHQQIVEVTENEKYYIVVGQPDNLYYFLINAAQHFSVELI